MNEKLQTLKTYLKARGKKFVLVAIATAGIALAVWLFWYLNYQKREVPESEQNQPTREEILKNLTAPNKESSYTEEEKEIIFDSLTAPKNISAYTEEEKRNILDSLSVP